MKRYTALFTAMLFILVLASGGVVYLFNTAKASDSGYVIPNYISNTPAAEDTWLWGYYANNQAAIGFTKTAEQNNISVVGCRYFYDNNHEYTGIIIMSTESISIYQFSYEAGNFNSSAHRYGVSLNNTYSDGYYYYNATLPFNGQGDVALNQEAALEICYNLLNPRPEMYQYTFSLPAGYVAYVQIYQETNIDLVCKMPELSKLWISGPEPTFWSGMHASVGVSNSYPSIGSYLNLSIMPYINWERGPDRNSYNQTKTALSSWVETVSNGYDYLIIYNPPYYDLQESNEQVIGPTITVTVYEALEVKMYSVVNSYINGVERNTITKEFDVSPTGNITDPGGNPTTPEVGGGNYVPDNSDMDTSVGNLVSNIDGFFNGTWRYIRQLIESIATFPQFVVQLYSWLPIEFKGVLFSAFSIVVVVAVLKVML